MFKSMVTVIAGALVIGAGRLQRSATRIRRAAA